MHVNNKAYFKHDINSENRKWYVGDRALFSKERSARLPLVFLAPIYVPIKNQLVKSKEKPHPVGLNHSKPNVFFKYLVFILSTIHILAP